MIVIESQFEPWSQTLD